MAQTTNAETPPWLREESLEHVQPLTSPVAPVINQNQVMADEKKPKLVYWALKVVTMALCVLMAGTAIIGVESINGVESTGKIFVATYMLFFSTLLFVFELVELKKIDWVDNMLRRNFGFLYGQMGKAFFIIFIAFLSFGLGDPASLTFATGFSLCMFGVLQLALYLKYPEMFDEQL